MNKFEKNIEGDTYKGLVPLEVLDKVLNSINKLETDRSLVSYLDIHGTSIGNRLRELKVDSYNYMDIETAIVPKYNTYVDNQNCSLHTNTIPMYFYKDYKEQIKDFYPKIRDFVNTFILEPDIKSRIYSLASNNDSLFILPVLYIAIVTIYKAESDISQEDIIDIVLNSFLAVGEGEVCLYLTITAEEIMKMQETECSLTPMLNWYDAYLQTEMKKVNN